MSSSAKWNVLEAERDFDPHFFEGSPYRSWAFLLSTVTLSLDMGLAVILGTMVWYRMPIEIKGLYIVFVAGLPVVWARMVRDHNKMRQWYAMASAESRNDYPVRMASHLMTFSPQYFYALVLILLFFLSGTVRKDLGYSQHTEAKLPAAQTVKASQTR